MASAHLRNPLLHMFMPDSVVLNVADTPVLLTLQSDSRLSAYLRNFLKNLLCTFLFAVYTTYCNKANVNRGELMIADRIKLARRKAGLSLRGLSDAMKGRVTAQAIGKYERGEDVPSSGVLSALSKALGVSLGYLLDSQRIELAGVEFRTKSSTSARGACPCRNRGARMDRALLAGRASAGTR